MEGPAMEQSNAQVNEEFPQGNTMAERYSVASPKETDIAIIGVACRFPGAPDYETFWNNLASVTTSMKEVPADRWSWEAYYGDPAEKNYKTFSRWGGFIEDINKFDAAFFNITPREAELMDPQQRIMLELSWACLEDAGYTPKSLTGSKTGVFIGVCNYDYKELLEQSVARMEGHAATGTFATILPNRISYFFNFRGPSLSVDTSCSSSLVAVHQAVKSLQNKECSMALVGGVNIMCSPTSTISFSKLGILSPNDKCRVFDQQADGYIRGEGAGLILLKPLTQALADKDRIYAVIKGSAVNHGGQSKTLTSPNAEAQAQLIVAACQQAGITTDELSYIEAHGTGTPLGDPMEVWGIRKASQMMRNDKNKPEDNEICCGLGSVKANIGHLEAAAGIAGLIKVALALQHKILPGIAHLEQQNARLNLEDSPFYIVKETQEWKPLKDWQGRSLPRYAGISSFGFGGTNAHVVLEEGPPPPLSTVQTKSHYLVTFSARSPEVLQQKVQDMNEWLTQHANTPIEALSYTLNAGRSNFKYRCAFVVGSTQELQNKLLSLSKNCSEDIWIAQSGLKKEPNDIEMDEQVLQATLQAINDGKAKDETDYQHKLNILKELYLKGYTLDWHLLHHGEAQQRMGLPTYPFLKHRYWLPQAQARTNEGIAAVAGLQSQLSSALSFTEEKYGHENKDASTAQQTSPELLSRENNNKATLKSLQEKSAAYFKKLVSEITGFATQQIDSSRDLKEYGVDSITVGQLTHTLRKVIKTINSTVFFEFATIDTLVNHLIETHKDALIQLVALEKENATESAISETPLQPYDERAIHCLKTSEYCRVRLLIFHPFGFGIGSLSWANQLPADIEVWAVGSTVCSDWQELTIHLAENIKQLFDKPVVIWGHSLGTLVAFETLHYLETTWALQAKQLILSSAIPPWLFERIKYSSPFYEINEKLSEAEIESLLIKNHYLIPRESGIPMLSPEALWNDIRLCKEYFYDASKKLSTPLFMVQANNDILIKDASLIVPWGEMTTGSCQYEEIEGTHLFFVRPPQGFIDILVKNCMGSFQLKKQTIFPGVYTLKQMYTGTSDVHLYPLSLHASGYIIYTEDGYMAAHLWHPERLQGKTELQASPEKLMTYLAYTGEYAVEKGIVNHQVSVSLFADLENKMLPRYIDQTESEFTLSTSPLIMEKEEQDRLSLYQKLTWAPCSSNPAISAVPIKGCWQLAHITGLPDEMKDKPFKGQCIITAEGYISVLISHTYRRPFCYQNFALASSSEIEQTLQSCILWLGRLIKMDETESTCEILVSQTCIPMNIQQLNYVFSENQLSLSWSLKTEKAQAIVTKWMPMTKKDYLAAHHSEVGYKDRNLACIE
jgi:3-oxoacyl-(acyl-carrier-protein) synthase/surfactin synthase thioesterase subunit/aryl carrier-like protein